ncbi:MAG: sulfatase/phosphatase domain-containing protein, partial [Planctomycetota bacterium]
VRVPLIARWPQHIKPGRTSDHVSAFWDFVPTACQAAGLKPPKDTDGISYMATLLGERTFSDGTERRQAKHDHLYWEFYERGGKQAVRMGDWKGVRLNVLEDPAAPIELYNLADDLGEQNNVADSNPEIVSQIAAIMAKEHVPTRRNSLQN